MWLKFGPRLGAEKAAVLLLPSGEELMICRRAAGAGVPMPTLPPELIVIWSAPLPSRKEIWPPAGRLMTVSFRFGFAPNAKFTQPDKLPKPIAAVGEPQPTSPRSTSV